MTSIHSRIKDQRIALGLSMEELAKMVGVKSWQTIQQWENGATAPSRKRQEVVAKALEVTVAYLVTGTNIVEAQFHASKKVSPMRKKQDPHIAEVIRLMEATDATGRVLALGGVKAALDKYVPAAKKGRAK